MVRKDGVFYVKDGKGSIRKAIQNDVDEIRSTLDQLYEEDEDSSVNPQDPDAIRLTSIYVNRIKQHLTDFKDIRMYGTISECCGYGLGKETYKYENACTVEYHADMFNRRNKPENKTVERLLNEGGCHRLVTAYHKTN